MNESTKICKFCKQPVETIPQQSPLTGKIYPQHTCKNRQCRAGKLDITLGDEQFDALDEATLESYERATGGMVRYVPARQAVA